MTGSRIEGFEIGFHSSLSEPVTIGGVPRMIAVLNGTVTATLALGLQVPMIDIPLGLAVHVCAYWLTKRRTGDQRQRRQHHVVKAARRTQALRTWATRRKTLDAALDLLASK